MQGLFSLREELKRYWDEEQKSRHQELKSETECTKQRAWEQEPQQQPRKVEAECINPGHAGCTYGSGRIQQQIVGASQRRSAKAGHRGKARPPRIRQSTWMGTRAEFGLPSHQRRRRIAPPSRSRSSSSWIRSRNSSSSPASNGCATREMLKLTPDQQRNRSRSPTQQRARTPDEMRARISSSGSERSASREPSAISARASYKSLCVGTSNWDVMQAVSNIATVAIPQQKHKPQQQNHQNHQKQQQQKPSNHPRKARECYVGNLLKNEINEAMLRQTFDELFVQLPAFREAYSNLTTVVRGIRFPDPSLNIFCFVEFHDEVIASTAIRMNGFRLCGRPIKVGPGYVDPRVEGSKGGNICKPDHCQAPPLDVTVLVESGVIPPEKTLSRRQVIISNKLRELYFGNLPKDRGVDELVLSELVTPACLQLPEYDSNTGPPITNVDMTKGGTFCFIQFQSAELATRVLSIFQDMEFLGKRLNVNRPTNSHVSVHEATQSSAPPLTSLPPPPPPLSLLKLPPPPPPPADEWLDPSRLSSDLLAVAMQELSAGATAAALPP